MLACALGVVVTPGWTRGICRFMVWSPAVIVDDVDMARVAVMPDKTYPLRVIDPDAVLAASVAAESLESVPGRQRHEPGQTKTRRYFRLDPDRTLRVGMLEDRPKQMEFWWRIRDSNPGPADYDSAYRRARLAIHVFTLSRLAMRLRVSAICSRARSVS